MQLNEQNDSWQECEVCRAKIKIAAENISEYRKPLTKMPHPELASSAEILQFIQHNTPQKALKKKRKIIPLSVAAGFIFVAGLWFHYRFAPSNKICVNASHGFIFSEQYISRKLLTREIKKICGGDNVTWTNDSVFKIALPETTILSGDKNSRFYFLSAGKELSLFLQEGNFIADFEPTTNAGYKLRKIQLPSGNLIHVTGTRFFLKTSLSHEYIWMLSGSAILQSKSGKHNLSLGKLYLFENNLIREIPLSQSFTNELEKFRALFPDLTKAITAHLPSKNKVAKMQITGKKHRIHLKNGKVIIGKFRQAGGKFLIQTETKYLEISANEIRTVMPLE